MSFEIKDKVSKALLRIRYLELRERYALQWTFVFYNNGSGWTLVSLFV